MLCPACSVILYERVALQLLPEDIPLHELFQRFTRPGKHLPGNLPDKVFMCFIDIQAVQFKWQGGFLIFTPDPISALSGNSPLGHFVAQPDLLSFTLAHSLRAASLLF